MAVNKRVVLAFVAPAVLGLAFWVGRTTQEFRPAKSTVHSLRSVHQPKLTTSVSALGILSPSGDVHVLASPLMQMSGSPRIKRIVVREGDRVARNQLLVTFDNSPQVLAERNRVLANIERKNQEIKILTHQTMRYQQLMVTGSLPVSDFEEKRLRLASFQSQLQELIGTLKTSNERLASDTAIRSPINGVVLRINARAGERAKESGVIEVGNTNQMQAVVEVEEADISSVRIGQHVIVTSENGAFVTSLNGTVSSIGLKAIPRKMFGQDPGLAPDSEVRVIEVRVNLDANSSRLVRSLTGVKIMAIIKTS
jgi:HlyD family secretion protein